MAIRDIELHHTSGEWTVDPQDTASNIIGCLSSAELYNVYAHKLIEQSKRNKKRRTGLLVDVISHLRAITGTCIIPVLNALTDHHPQTQDQSIAFTPAIKAVLEQAAKRFGDFSAVCQEEPKTKP